MVEVALVAVAAAVADRTCCTVVDGMLLLLCAVHESGDVLEDDGHIRDSIVVRIRTSRGQGRRHGGDELVDALELSVLVA